MLEGVLFDFDAVLADTMEDNYNAWRKTLLKYNIQINREEYFLIEGTKVTEVPRVLSRNHELIFSDKDYEKMVETKNKIYLDECNFKFYDEIPELVDYLYNLNKKLAIISASPREKFEKIVPKSFLQKFGAVLSNEDYKNGKPNPEPYLKALERLDLSSDKCIVIENAPLGIKSAKSAEIYCVALTTTLNREYLREADIIFENHRELLDYFKNYFKD